MDGGALLLGEVEARTRIIERLAGLFVDYRDPEASEHSVRELVGQWVFALAIASIRRGAAGNASRMGVLLA